MAQSKQTRRPNRLLFLMLWLGIAAVWHLGTRWPESAGAAAKSISAAAPIGTEERSPLQKQPPRELSHVEQIRREALRPNHDPEGRALPLAARWTCHNFMDGKLSPSGHRVTFPFPLNRLMDDIDRGRRIMPFIGWPRAQRNAYFEPFDQLLTGFRRLAAAGLPFEFEAGNIEDSMFGGASADEFWHRPMADNPAHITDSARLRQPAMVGATQLVTSDWPTGRKLAVGTTLLCGSRVHSLAEAVAADADGNALLSLREPLTAELAADDGIAVIQRKMDYWSAAPADLWEAAGRGMVLRHWGTDETVWKRLAEIYPDPPQIQVVSNNEGGGKVGVGAAGASWHARRRQAEFQQMFPAPREEGVERLAYAHGYVEKMGAYFRGIRQAMPWPEERIKLIGYNGFGVNFEVGRWGGWRDGAIPLRQADMYPWLAWDGAAPDFYVYDWNYATDEHVGSPHIGSMQAYTMLYPRAEKQVPGYQWQLALWDGGMRMRYRYVREGMVPPAAVIGTLAEDLLEGGGMALRVQAAGPGLQVARRGDIISIAGNSDVRTATCTVKASLRLIPDEETAGDAADEPTGVDIGDVRVPGTLERQGNDLLLVGGGRILHGQRDHLYFVQQPFAGMRRIEANLSAMSNPDRGYTAAESLAQLPEHAQHVDTGSRQQQEQLDALAGGRDSAARTGLMIRRDDAPDAPFFAILRRPNGILQTVWRERANQELKWGADADAARAPDGPVLLAIERGANGGWLAAWRAPDQHEWQQLPGAKVDLGAQPLAGIAVTAWNHPDHRLRAFTVADNVVADDSGLATIPLARIDFTGPALVNDRHRPVGTGAEVYLHDYASRYEGLCHMALWLTRPRIIREFAWGDYDELIEAHWERLLRAVDAVWEEPVLTRFWRRGTLVVNPDYEATTGFKHPFWELTDHDQGKRHGPWLDRWQKQDRFHLLNVAVNPPFKSWPQRYEVAWHTSPSSDHARIRVWAIAYKLGTAPNREWLLIVQSPRKDRDRVEVEVPGYGKVEVAVPRTSAFYHLRENAAEASRVR